MENRLNRHLHIRYVINIARYTYYIASKWEKATSEKVEKQFFV